MRIFLVVMYDRHCDDQYEARTEWKAAKRVADEFMQGYGDKYVWERQDDGDSTYTHTTHSDDGPRVHVELLEVS